ncbi:MAG: hypothetical protein ACLUNS_01325 [Alistipes shahii]
MLRGIIRRGAKSARSRSACSTAAIGTGARWIAFEELPDSLRVVPGQEFNKIKIGDRKTALNRLPQFRREVKVTKPVERATVYVSGLGQFELFLNGGEGGRQFPRPCVERLRQAACATRRSTSAKNCSREATCSV